ncbi:MAG: sugar-binding protein [Armatimonadota bacterium]
MAALIRPALCLLVLLVCGSLTLAAPMMFTAEQLLPGADACGGRLDLLAPPPEKLKVESGKLLLFKPAPTKTTLILTLPVPADGYYRISCRYVYGPWRNGHYGMYSVFADGVGLQNAPHYMHGWYGAGVTPAYRMGDKELGAVFLCAPSVTLAFTREVKNDGDLLGLEWVRLEAVDPVKLTETERNRRVPERPAATMAPAAPWPTCQVEAEMPFGWMTPAPPLAKPVTLDGNLAEWDFAKPLIAITAASITGRGTGAPPPDNDADLSLTAQLAWDAANLYLAARVRDDMPAKTVPGKPWSSFWSHDGLVFQTHTPPWITRRAGISSTVKDLCVGFNYYSPGAAPRELPGGIQYRIQPAKDGYTLEAVIPFTALGCTPVAGDRLPFLLIAVDMDPGKPAGREFKQYLWNTRGGDFTRWGEMRLATSTGWCADVLPEKEAYQPGQPLRYLAMLDVFKPGLTLKAVQVVDAQTGKVLFSEPVALKLTANRRLRLRGELPVPQLKEGRYDIRLQVE